MLLVVQCCIGSGGGWVLLVVQCCILSGCSWVLLVVLYW